MQNSQSLTINLAKGRGETFLDRFFAWALTVGRVLIIITETVALGAFLFRFSLDRQLVDLHDHIAQQQAIVNLLKNSENTFRNLQDRLALAKAIMSVSNQTTKTFQDIVAFIPTGMDLKTISLSQDAIKVDASVQTVESLTQFIDKLKSYPQVATVSIDKIENKTTTSTINVTITALFKKAQVNASLL